MRGGQWHSDSDRLLPYRFTQFWGFDSFSDCCFTVETLPKFLRILTSSSCRFLQSSVRDGFLIGELAVQHWEAGWHQLSILERADLQCVGAEEVGETFEVIGHKARGHAKGWLGWDGWVGQIHNHVDTVNKCLLQCQGYKDESWVVGEALWLVQVEKCGLTHVMAEVVGWS